MFISSVVAFCFLRVSPCGPGAHQYDSVMLSLGFQFFMLHVCRVAADIFGLHLGYYGCDATGSGFFNPICMHAQLFNHKAKGAVGLFVFTHVKLRSEFWLSSFC